LALVVRSTITKSAEMHEMLPRAAQPRNAVVPNGVDRALFHEVAREDARRDLRWPFDELVVLFAARRCVLRKRFDVAEEACALLAARGLDVRLRVCEGRPQHEVATWMNASDVLLLPSLAEGSPNVVKEALACNLPVVASDVGDVQELLRGVQPSAVLPVDAGPAEYADALASILATAPMRSNGRMQTAHLEADIVAERVEAIYEQLVEKRRELVAEGARVVA
jgi:glycosyltransferase involved in cell wall biosynthesis